MAAVVAEQAEAEAEKKRKEQRQKGRGKSKGEGRRKGERKKNGGSLSKGLAKGSTIDAGEELPAHNLKKGTASSLEQRSFLDPVP